MLPGFDENGNLPPGVHLATIDEVIQHFSQPGYGTRRTLSDNLREFYGFVRHFALGLYLDGSYITAKTSPSDVDIALVLRPTFDVNSIQGLLLLSWMRKKDGLDIFLYTNVGPAAVRLENMVRFWSRDRDNHPKGIVYVETSP